MLALAALVVAAAPPSDPNPPPHWNNAQVDKLIGWMTTSSDDGLAIVPAEIPRLRLLLKAGDQAATDSYATQAAEELLSDLIAGCCNASLRSNWHIANGLEHTDRGSAVAAAVADDKLDALFAEARPAHPFYAALRFAYGREQDPARRAILAANLDRWRWMPRKLGSRYLLINAANFEVTLWQGDQKIGRWAVIVGKTRSPTPVFAARVTGVTINPWWEIPPAIARESVVGLLARRPAEAAKRGYVLAGGRYRQRPGPTNSLGRMKLVMPNPYNVYLHDTPVQALFKQDVRAFSHGCVRVDDALGLATALLGSQWDRSRLDAVVAAGATQTIELRTPIPVYIAYFTAEPDDSGGIRYFPDVYRRDSGAKAPTPEGNCPR